MRTSGTTWEERIAIFVFRRDLRVADHLGLEAISRRGPIIPIWVLDDSFAARLRRSPRRAAYLCRALRALDAALAARGSRLVVRRGPLTETVETLARETGASAVGMSRLYDDMGIEEQRALEAAQRASGREMLFAHDAVVAPPGLDGAFRERGARALAPYAERWRAALPPRAEVPAPSFVPAAGLPSSENLPEPEDFGAQPDDTPITAAGASERLRRFLQGPIFQYAASRHAPSGETSRLSAPLSFGVLSPRAVVRGALELLKDPFILVEERISVELFLRALATRDFFLQLAWFNEGIERRALRPAIPDFRIGATHPALEAWLAGRTGYPLVDAGIRELQSTGAMHPHVRAVAASFLCFDLGIDWRAGVEAWDRLLIEDDAALAAGNWQWIAGVGADLAAYPRIYNPLRQARRFDPGARYIRAHLPELAGLPDETIFEPGHQTLESQLRLDLFASGYPAPVIDHDEAARAFLRRYAQARRGPVSEASGTGAR